MGRLDEQAKKRIVELRKAGLSFRKIKKVLELNNIRVTPQAVYLFLKRKNVEPESEQVAGPSVPLAAGGGRKADVERPAWEEQQLWNLMHENSADLSKGRELQGPTPSSSTQPAARSGSLGNPDSKEGIKIVSVTSLYEDSRQFGKASAPMGPPLRVQLQALPQPKSSDCAASSGNQPSMSASRPAPVLPVHSPPPNQLNSRGRMPFALPRNPALIVRKKIVDRAIHLQKKVNIQNGQSVSPFLVEVPSPGQSARLTQAGLPASCLLNAHVKDVSTQTDVASPSCAHANPSPLWSGRVLPPPQPTGASCQLLTEKIEAVHTGVQKLTQALNAIAERQCCMERQQEQQQRFQQEVLMTLQQLSSTLSHSQVPPLGHGQSPLNQNCIPYGNMPDPTPAMPSFGEFKMELL
ncbi:uncharacterized protein LOC115075969 isoform X1 [Rhinatrema bivittatum]|uniref:uncharacterized protein LOC115075969 isoform X1 n=1 Tax=Rhinatrema bivittatum TaxID=194408 RepID=UPI00112B7766|nr:uncharacterized protein LOC115075969 isoform X1 [Rhinatrema bivittatum]XP_029432830.1 uncharacterized protein LOC115075969 isoform X1 [Rhinatrema bivittatum]XP_029432831.1 uncharacterized protein LOC115075969 isoform X1 [Rhinatrema bivittatum]XP_029432833.1 uncharacterized protein LOC115075969 isoform X1 [Rhinatrema bivittatum]XP_029432834.1 uncharacterized protein LOC115075969 isoform X1 [Rhinatrema bivittatum]